MDPILTAREPIPETPQTLIARNNLATAYGSAGDLDRAIALLQTTLADFERILGPQHPQTATARANLTAALEAQDRETGSTA
jgi:hypothetical protein